MSIKGEKSVLWLTLILLTVLMYWPVFSSGRLPGGEMSDTVAQDIPSFHIPLNGLPVLSFHCGTPGYFAEPPSMSPSAHRSSILSGAFQCFFSVPRRP